jgi:hypothetical protein
MNHIGITDKEYFTTTPKELLIILWAPSLSDVNAFNEHTNSIHNESLNRPRITQIL